jgi:hypothetical protein
MKNLVKKYFLESNKLVIILFLTIGCVYAFVIALKWNKTFDSFWGLGYFLIALTAARFLYKTFVAPKIINSSVFIFYFFVDCFLA